MKGELPEISIITVVFNAEEHIERTIKSILHQSRHHFEYLIVDGGSTDATLDILEKYRKKIDILVSEPDEGLYDAMNKGLKMAKGRFVWFINAGDEIADNEVIDKISPYLSQADILYSDTLVIDRDGREIGLLSKLTHNNAPEQLNWKKMRYGMVVCHQSFIVRREIAPFFDLKYRLSADIDWVISCLKKSKKVIKTPFILSKFMQAGLSKKHLKKAMQERFFILNKHYGTAANLFSHLIMLIRFLVSGRKSKVG